ncbi:hypothetical protein [Actinotalea sp. Marseille-Q4924]|uniref:hypothetical protein n=1 Tax=Actinotalea sp. Marseille-Q4924 TaxID=2866571 RepID=UPI001CE47054|nr:hypothetical protein [Actinotalea sp. Marseille-Q4924]
MRSAALRAVADRGAQRLLGPTAWARELAEVDDLLRRRVSTSRRLAVVQAHGGAGATTTVARAATALARRRSGGVLVVDAAQGDGELARRAGLADPLALAQCIGRTAGVVTAAQARRAVPTAASGLHVLGSGTDGPGAPAGPVTPAGWRTAVDPIGRFFDVVLTDWGVRTDPTDLTEIAASHHVVAVVARADRAPAERGLGAVARLLEAAPRTAVALVLVDVGGTAGPTDRLARRVLTDVGLAVPVHVVAHASLTDAPPRRRAGPVAQPAQLGPARLVGELLVQGGAR